MKIKTKTLAGTAILAALVFVFDYAMKNSGLKIPFPLLPNLKLKFDFTGIPIVLSLCLFGFLPGLFTSVVAFFVIFVRSGDAVAAFMKTLAELSTVVGMACALKVAPRYRRGMSLLLGLLARCLIMFFANLLVLPTYYQTPFATTLAISPFIALFNAVQGSISILGGLLIFEAVKKRIPSLTQRSPRQGLI